MKKRIFIVAIVVICGLQLLAQEKTVKFIIHTDYGDMKGYLYNDTPKHRDNFVKLVEEGWYNGSIFHRVIQNFMIQGGQNAAGKMDPGYKVPAEFTPAHFHKKGALAAARQGDQVNPKKESSGSQFYIVQGQVYNQPTLNMMEGKMGTKFIEEQLKAYSTVGGTPHLDGEYTVFGQIADGFDVIDKIAAVKTQPGDRPADDVKMTIEIVK
ncbi:MAG: peptidylprolyl isomerase [Bacteroidales bacterium]|nr:peptidylprolyl isomerase [Bacteroidales bacterium]